MSNTPADFDDAVCDGVAAATAKQTYTFRVGVRMTGADKRRKIFVEGSSAAEADAKARDLLDEDAHNNGVEAPVRWDLELCPDKKHVYRVGDVVRIVEPKFVERVGYPLVWPMLMEEFEAKLPMVREAMKDLIIADASEEMFKFNRAITRTETDATDRDFLKGVCMAAVRIRGFGGDARSIYYHEAGMFEHTRGTTTIVHRKRTCKTGTRFAGHSSYSYEGEYNYENGGLSDEKTHVLLYTDWGEIEASNVELVKVVEPMFYIRNARSVVGNSIMWWCPDGNGYTCDLKKAWKVPESKARGICRDRPKEDFMIPAKKAEASTELHVDSQLFPLHNRRRTAKAKRVEALEDLKRKILDEEEPDAR